MKLDPWMENNKVTNAAMARALNCGRERVRRMRLPEADRYHREPTREEWRAIAEFTKGEVTPNDEYGIDKAGAAPEARA